MLDRRFNRDVLWNLASVAVLGLCGVSINVVIGRYYGSETLGVFNQVLAVYYVLSQLSVGGFVFSSLKFVSDHAEKKENTGTIISAAVLITGLLAAVVCIIAYFTSPLIGQFFDSSGVSTGVVATLPGLWCFAINKVLLYSINGLRHMRFYAIGNALRYLFILIILVLLVVFQADGVILVSCISAGEALLLPILFMYLFWRGHFRINRHIGEWVRNHAHFGTRSFFSGLLMDINIKIDVVMLGYFASDYVVGVYSFAAMLAEGMYQIIIVVQSNVNPLLSRIDVERRQDLVKSMVRQNMRTLCPLMATATVVGIVLFPFFTLTITGDTALASGQVYFAILAIGMTIASSYIPFNNLLNQWGHPGWFMVYSGLMVGTNVLLNALFIPIWGGAGAASASVVSFLLSIYYLKRLTRYVTRIII